MMVGGKDIDIELNKKNDGDLEDLIDENSVIESLHNIFKTIPGQRRRLPTFATNLFTLLFDPIDEITAREIGVNMFSAIRTGEPRVIVEDILIKPNADMHRYDITLTFRIKNIHSPSSFVIQETIQAA